MSLSLSFSVYGVEYGPFAPPFQISAPNAYDYPLKFTSNNSSYITIINQNTNERYYDQASINDVLTINPPGGQTTNYVITLYNSNGINGIYYMAFTVDNFTIPSPPSNVIVAAGPGNAVVQWTPPEFRAGNADLQSPVSQYTVSSSPGSVVVITNDTSATVSGLTDGTPYTFTVTYTYGVENIRLYTSRPSHPSRIVTPGPPYPANAPTALTVFALPDSSVLLSWTAPIETGNTTLTGYQVARVVDGSNNPITTNVVYNGATATVTGLTDHASYAFAVAAVNIAGVGSYSAASITVPITSAVAGVYSDISSGSTADFISAIQAAAVNDPEQALIDGLAAIRFGITSLSLTLVQQSDLTAALATALTTTAAGPVVTIPITNLSSITSLMQSVTTATRVLSSLPTVAIIPVYSSGAASFDLSSNCTINGQSMTYAQALQNREAYFIFILPATSHQLTLTYNSASTTLTYTGNVVMNNGTALNANQGFLLGGLSIPLLGLGPLGLGSSSNDTAISVFNVSAAWKAPYVYETEQAATSFDLLLETRESHATILLLDPLQNILSSGSNSVSLSPSLLIGSNVFAIAVTAQDGTVQNYSLTVVVPPLSNDTSIRIVVAGVPASYNSGTKSFSVSVGPELSSASFSITANESHAIASIGDLSGNNIQGVWSPISNGDTVYSIQSIARDGTVAHYPLTVTNVLSSDTSLQIFNVGSVPIGGSGLTYTLNEWSSTAIERFIHIRTTEAHAEINGLGFAGTFDVSGQLTFPFGTTSQSFTVTAHDGTQATYTFIVIVAPPVIISQATVEDPQFALQDGTGYELAGNLIMTAPFRFAQFGQTDTGIVVNGAGYTIDVTDNSEWLGLFNKFVTVKNLGVHSTNSVIAGNSGWFFGANTGGRAIKCYSTGEIPTGAGGIFGSSSTGTAEYCYSTGAITGMYAGGGGIFAPYSSGTATNCYSTGEIGNYGGGIFGQGSSGTANNCYSINLISAYAGGIFGQGCNGTANNCYSTGEMVSYAGGIFGAESHGTANNCYSIGSLAGFSGLIFGLNSTINAPNCYATGGGPWSDTAANQSLKGFPGDTPRVWFSASPNTPYQLLTNHIPNGITSIISVVVNSTPLTADPATGVYSYNLPGTAASVAFNIEATIPLATVSVGDRSALGYLSGSLNLLEGSNSFTILVTAETGGEPTSYSLVIDNSNSGPVAQVVTFSEQSLTKTFGDAPFVLAATASANTAITYTCSPSDVLDISGSLATILKAGSCVITATAAASPNYLSASATQAVTVTQATPVITWNAPYTAPLNKTVGDAAFDLSGAVSSTGDGVIRYTSSDTGVVSITGSVVTVVGAGSCAITATVEATSNYATAIATATLDVTVTLPPSDFVISGTTLTGYTGPGGAITIPDSVTEIATIAFFGNETITSVIFPVGLTTIGQAAFENCPLTFIEFKAGSPVAIGNDAFRSITLTEVHLPIGSTYVLHETISFGFGGSYTVGSFPQGCTVVADLGSLQLQNVTFSSSSLTKTYGDVFDLTGAAVTTGDGAISYTSSDTSVVDISGTTATVVGAGSCVITATAAETASYLSASATQAVTVTQATPVITWNAPYTAPLSKTVGDAAFDLSGAAVTTGDGVISYTSSNTGVIAISGTTATVVGAGSCAITATVEATSNYATATATLDVTVTLPPSDFVISGTTLTGYTGSGGAITIPDSVTAIGASAFFENFSLTSVIIPSSVTSIGENAFHSCTSLTSVTIPSSVTSIGDAAFNSCTSLTAVTIPPSVTVISPGTFAICTSLTSITIPSDVTSIGDYAFDSCTSLTSVTIPPSVTSIGVATFANCTNLTFITLPPSITSIAESLFYHCSSLPSINIPSGVTSIGDNAFNGCTSLTSITIPSSVSSIGSYSFRGSGLTTVLLPYSTVLGALAFNSAVTVRRTQAALSINSLGTLTIGSTIQLSCSGGSGDGEITYSSDNTAVIRISGSTAIIEAAGEGILITAIKAASANYEAATATALLTVASSDPGIGGGGGGSSGGIGGGGPQQQATLNIVPFLNVELGDAPIILSCTGGSGTGAITYSCTPSGILIISGNIATIVGIGSGVSITATKVGDSVYASISSTPFAFDVTEPRIPSAGQVVELAKNNPTQDAYNAYVMNAIGISSDSAAQIAKYDEINRAALVNTDPGASVLLYNAMKEALDPTGATPIEMISANASYINTTNFRRVASNISPDITSSILSFPNFTDGVATIDLPIVLDNTQARLYKCPIDYSIVYRHGGVSNTIINRADGLYLVKNGAETPYVLGTPISFEGNFKYTIWAQGSNIGTGGDNGENNVVPCFTRGTMIRVPGGEVAVETLKAGDLVTTADGRTVAIKGLYKTRVAATTKETAPYLIPAGTYGSAQPRDLLLSPKHAIQIRKGVWNFPGFATRTNAAIRQVAVGEAVDYYHLECPVFLRDNLVANGCVVESFGTLQVRSNPYTYSARLGGFTRQGSFTRQGAGAAKALSL